LYHTKNYAIEKYNEAYDNIIKDAQKDCVVLSPRFGISYNILQARLESIGVKVLLSDNAQYATIDLSFLLGKSPSFQSERLLFSELLSSGLLMSPGEAHGASNAGYFRITCPVLSDELVRIIAERLSDAIKSFKLPSDTENKKKKNIFYKKFTFSKSKNEEKNKKCSVDVGVVESDFKNDLLNNNENKQVLEDGNISKKRKKYECDDNLILN
jgi:hypothetical protein